MPRQLKHVIREPLKLQRLRRKYKQRSGEIGSTYLAKVSGAVYGSKSGHFYVHDPSGVDSAGNTTYGAVYQLPILPGATIDPRPNMKVETVVLDGTRYIARMAFSDLLSMGYDPHQTNRLDPRIKYILIEHLSNLQSFPDGSGLTVRVMPTIYRKSNGQYEFYTGETGIDLSSYIPSTDMQVVVCLWLDVGSNSISTTGSSELSRDTILKEDPSLAMPYINECKDSAPAGSIGVTAYILFDDTTAITVLNKFHDLRGLIGTGGGAGGSGGNVISKSNTIPSGKDAFFAGGLTITGGLTVSGEMYILP